MGAKGGSDDGAGETARHRRILLGVATVVAVYAVVLAVTGFQDALTALNEARWAPLGGALLLELVTMATLAQVHRNSAAAVRGQLTQSQAFNISMSTFTVSQTVPGGGAVAGALLVRRLERFGLEGPQAAASLVLTGSLATVTIALIAAGGMVPGVLDAELPELALVGVLGLVALLVAAVAVTMAVLRSPRVAHRLLHKIGRLHPRLDRRVDGWQESLRGVHAQPPTLGSLAHIVGWSSVNWSADIAALGLVFVALDTPVPLTVLLVGFAVSQVGAAIPLTPGGVGFVESGMVGAFVALGSPMSVATTVVVLYRLLATWLPALAGVSMLLRPPAGSGGSPRWRGDGISCQQ